MNQDLQASSTRHSVSTRTGRDRQTRFLAQSIRLSEAESPGIVNETIYTICFTVLGFIVWAAIAHVNEIARAPGEVIPAGQIRVVQHRDGGTVAEVFVRDGQTVNAGTPLLRLDETEAKQDLAQANARQANLTLQEERLNALLDNRRANFDTNAERTENQQAFLDSQRLAHAQELAAIEDQIRQKQAMISAAKAESVAAAESVSMLERLTANRQKLNREGVLADVRLMETRQRLNDAKSIHMAQKGRIAAEQAALAELYSRKSAIAAGWDSDTRRELAQVQAEKQENTELISKLNARLSAMVVTAPVDGRVQGLAVQMRGSVAQPGQPLMEIVPSEAPLVVSLKIPPRDIGHISTGQDVHIKVSSFDFSRHGAVSGRLQSLSPSTFRGENGERYYEGTVALDTLYVGSTVNRIQPGMTVMADIVTGQKSILAYLAKPLQSVAASAFTER